MQCTKIHNFIFPPESGAMDGSSNLRWHCLLLLFSTKHNSRPHNDSRQHSVLSTAVPVLNKIISFFEDIEQYFRKDGQ